MKGFTLVEFIIYITILTTILVSITGFLWLVVLGNIKETSYQEIQQNGRFAMTKITQEIKKATGVNHPLPGNPPSDSLSLFIADPNLNPTIFDVVDGKLRITQGTNTPFELTSDQVIVSNLQFTNLSYSDTPGIIRIEMTVDHVNPGNRGEYQASIDLTSSISLVPGGAVTPPFEILRPTAFNDVARRTTNPELAFDEPNGTTFATTQYGGKADPSITFHTWETPTQTYNSLVLKYRYHADSATDDTYAVAYSTDSGLNWVDLVSPTSAGVSDTTVSAILSLAQDLSQLRVKIHTRQTKGPDNKNLYTRDIWTEGTF